MKGDIYRRKGRKEAGGIRGFLGLLKGGRRIGGDFFERKEKGELFWIVRGDSFWVRARIGGFFGAGREDSWIVGRRSTKELEKRAIATKAAQV